jgi:hypothetical protein
MVANSDHLNNNNSRGCAGGNTTAAAHLVDQSWPQLLQPQCNHLHARILADRSLY